MKSLAWAEKLCNTGRYIKKEDCKKVVDGTIKKYGRIDVLVNNGGIFDRHMPIIFCTEEWHNEVCMIAQYSVYYMSKYALEYMEKAGKGSIVNASSIGSQGVKEKTNIKLYRSENPVYSPKVGPAELNGFFSASLSLSTFLKYFCRSPLKGEAWRKSPLRGR